MPSLDPHNYYKGIQKNLHFTHYRWKQTSPNLAFIQRVRNFKAMFGKRFCEFELTGSIKYSFETLKNIFRLRLHLKPISTLTMRIFYPVEFCTFESIWFQAFFYTHLSKFLMLCRTSHMVQATPYKRALNPIIIRKRSGVQPSIPSDKLRRSKVRRITVIHDVITQPIDSILRARTGPVVVVLPIVQSVQSLISGPLCPPRRLNEVVNIRLQNHRSWVYSPRPTQVALDAACVGI